MISKDNALILIPEVLHYNAVEHLGNISAMSTITSFGQGLGNAVHVDSVSLNVLGRYSNTNHHSLAAGDDDPVSKIP
jgi:hypothetical protein